MVWNRPTNHDGFRLGLVAVLMAGRFVVSEKTYRAWRPDQAWLLPPSPKDWLPEGHLVYFLMDAVRELDMGAITAHYERELRGDPPGC